MCVSSRQNGREQPMNRQEAVLILKEMIAVCRSFSDAQAVSLAENKAVNRWELHIHCLPHASDVDCLKKICEKYNLEMDISGGKTVFRSL